MRPSGPNNAPTVLRLTLSLRNLCNANLSVVNAGQYLLAAENHSDDASLSVRLKDGVLF